MLSTENLPNILCYYRIKYLSVYMAYAFVHISFAMYIYTWRSSWFTQAYSSLERSLLSWCFTFLSSTALWANSADDKLIVLIFPRQQNLIFHAKWRLFAWTAKSCFLGNNKKNISLYHLLKILLRIITISFYDTAFMKNITSGESFSGERPPISQVGFSLLLCE